MATNATIYVVVNPGLNLPQQILNQSDSRIGIEVFNDGRVGGDLIGIYVGVQQPDLSRFTAIILPFGQWWPPSNICLTLPLWLIWLSNVGATKAYVTEYTRA